MSFLDKLERTFGRFAIPGLSLYLIIGQVFVVLSTMAGLLNPGYLGFLPRLALMGEWWRVVTFLFQPIGVGPGLLGIVSLVFGWWIFYFMGGALEGYWGAFRYNLFLLTGYALTVGLAFLFPDSPVTYAYLAGSVFLAFAYLNPDFELLIFFVLPVKIRWLGLLTWLLYLFQFITAGWSIRVQIGSALFNLGLFFGRDVWLAAGRRTRRISIDAGRAPRGRPRRRSRAIAAASAGRPTNRTPSLTSATARNAPTMPATARNISSTTSTSGAPMRPRRAAEPDLLAGAPRRATLGEWLRFAEALYEREKIALGQVSATAHDEALYLLLHALGRPLDSGVGALRHILSAGERAAVGSVLRRRIADRVPAAYITKEAWLGGHRFYVDERVIIPRSYFVEIIPQLKGTPLRIADVCTGSGCLAILLAHHFPQAAVDAIDLSSAGAGGRENQCERPPPLRPGEIARAATSSTGCRWSGTT